MKPILCNYYVTYRCNATCSFCDIWEQPSPMVALDDVARNLDDLRKIGVRIIDFTGGEPLLHPEIGELLRMAKDRGFLTSITTNGLLYPKRAEAMRGLVDLLHFSIDSPNPHEHDASRGVRCFGKLMESVEVALALGERPDLLFTVMNENVHHLDSIYETISRPNKLVLLINPLFEYNGLGDALADDVMAKVRQFGKKRYTYLNPAFMTLRERGGNDPKDPICKAVSTTIVISPFDELVLPCYHAGMEKLPIRGRLFDVWQSDRVVWHRAMEGRHDFCAGCTVNCYFEPSMATTPSSRYFWEALPSKARYAWTKFVVQRMHRRLGPTDARLPDISEYLAKPQRPAAQPPGDGASVEMVDLPVLSTRPPALNSSRTSATPH